MNEVQRISQPIATGEGGQAATLPSALRRRLIRGGLVGAPVVLTAVSTPVMAGTCKTASRFASMHSSLSTQTPTFTPVTGFKFYDVACALLKLFHPHNYTSDLQALTKLVTINGAGLTSYTLATSLVTQGGNYTLDSRQRLILLTYLNVTAPSAGTNLSVCLSAENVLAIANGTYQHPDLKTQQDIDNYLNSLFADSLGPNAAAQLTVVDLPVLTNPTATFTKKG